VNEIKKLKIVISGGRLDMDTRTMKAGLFLGAGLLGASLLITMPTPTAQGAGVNFNAFDTATGSPPPISVNEVKLFLNRIERMSNRKKMMLKYNHLAKNGVAMERIGNQISYYDRSTFDEKLKDDYKDLRNMAYRISIESVNVNGNRAFFRATVYQKATYPDYDVIRKQEWQKKKLKEEEEKAAKAAAGGPILTLDPSADATKPKPKPYFIQDPKKTIPVVYREMGTVEKRDGKLVFLLYSTEKLSLPAQASANSTAGGAVPDDGSGGAVPNDGSGPGGLDPSLLGG
jgi:hypothetical protein